MRQASKSRCWIGSGAPPPDLGGGAVGQDDARDRSDHVVRDRAARCPPPRPRGAARLEGERAVPRHQGGPAARDEPAQVVDRLRHGEPRRRVAACPSSRTRGGSASGPGRVTVAPWLMVSGRTPALAVAPHAEEGRALRRAEPLVAVAGVVRGAERAADRAAPCPARARRRRACRRRARPSSATRRSIGRTRPVGLVTWSRSARRVRGVTRASTASTTSSGDASGKRDRRDDDPGARRARRRSRACSGRRCRRGRW